MEILPPHHAVLVRPVCPYFLTTLAESSGLVRARGFVPVRQAPVDNMGVRPRVDDGVVAVLKASAAVPNQPGRREPPAAL